MVRLICSSAAPGLGLGARPRALAALRSLSTPAATALPRCLCTRASQLVSSPAAPLSLYFRRYLSCTTRASAAAPAAAPSSGNAKSGDAALQGSAGYWAPDDVSFESLGLHSDVVLALGRAGYARPTATQQMALPELLAGTNVVYAAETGSGKTIGYLAPLMSGLLAVKSLGLESGMAMVLCPNAALAEQVVASANELCGEDGRPLVHTAFVSSTKPPPFEQPDIVVSTPTGLINLLGERDSAFGSLWTPEGFIESLTYAVLDEADLLLSGGYERDMRFLLDEIKKSDREFTAGKIAEELGLAGGASAFRQLPMKYKNAGFSGGLMAMLAEGFQPPASAGDVEAIKKERGQDCGPAPYSLPTRYRKRQYAFVGATMPTGGKKSVAADIRKIIPGIKFVQGGTLHRIESERVEHRWLAVEDGTWVPTLQYVVGEDEDRTQGRGRMMVFSKDVASANDAAAALKDAGVPVLLYHKGVKPMERADALARMTDEEGSVMVCTDAAARGIDIPDVTHVVQADFAASAIDFVHRVGRTGRAGRSGKVTSIVHGVHTELAQEIKKAVDAGEPVEGVFSRNRSFRKKIRKYGQHKPRTVDNSYYGRE